MEYEARQMSKQDAGDSQASQSNTGSLVSEQRENKGKKGSAMSWSGGLP